MTLLARCGHSFSAYAQPVTCKLGFYVNQLGSLDEQYDRFTQTSDLESMSSSFSAFIGYLDYVNSLSTETSEVYQEKRGKSTIAISVRLDFSHVWILQHFPFDKQL